MKTNSKCRFLSEYANFKKAWLKESESDFRGVSEDIAEVDRAVRYCKRGLVTLDETMRMIANIGHETIFLS